MLSSNSSDDLETDLDLDPDSKHRSSPKYGRFFSSVTSKIKTPSTITEKAQTSNRQRSESFQEKYENYLKYRDHPMFRFAGEFKIDFKKDAESGRYTVIVREHRICGELIYANNEGKITNHYHSEEFKKQIYRNM